MATKLNYIAACTNRIGAESATPETHKPTPAECAQLSAPLVYFLSQCTCYDVLGTSTQVVVLDVNAPLAVAFIAAQETRVQSGVLWDPNAQSFVGVLSSTDYVKILLYCFLHPDKADSVSSWSIRQWRSMQDNWSAFIPSEHLKRMDHKALKHPPTGVVTCKTEDSLHSCLEKMMKFHVRRIVTMAEKEAESFSVVSLMDVEHIVEYLGVVFFHLQEKHHPGGGGAKDDEEAYVNGLFAIQKAQLPPHVTSILKEAEENFNDATTSPANTAGGGSGTTSFNTSTMTAGTLGTSPPGNASDVGGAGGSGSGGGGGFVPVGPYRSFFDVPYANLPSLGVHRRTCVFVTPDDSLRDALMLMLENDLETIAVVESKATPCILNIISRSDLLRMEDQGVYNINLTVNEALGSKISDEVYVFYERDTISNIFAHFVRRRVKELFMVDPDTGALLGQLNISELVFFLIFGEASEKKASESK